MLDLENESHHTTDSSVERSFDSDLPTLDELLASARAQRITEERERTERQTRERAEREANAIAHLRRTLDEVMSWPAQHALGLEIVAEDDMASAHCTVDGERWVLQSRTAQWWCIIAPGEDGEYVTGSDLEEALFRLVDHWRVRRARHNARGRTVTTRHTEPLLIQEQAGASGYRIYTLGAGSGCGSLDQFEQVIARIGIDGDVDVAFVTGRKGAHTHRATLSAAVMAQIVPLYTAYQAERVAAETSNDDANDANDDCPF
ncbi:MAG TPA: hypothetical protein VKQ30_25230 [Ktedonobacterales bacterium]|nr:hypothetical protein [Ktedonobacterales bacterium]